MRKHLAWLEQYTNMYGQISKQKPPMHEEIAKAEMATATEDKHQTEIVEEDGIRRNTPITFKEEPSTQYAVIDLTDKEGLPDIPAEAFNWPLKIKYDSYSESDVTDELDYLPDDVCLEETDEDLADMEDKNIGSVDVQQIEATMKQVSDGLQQAADGYDLIRKCLPVMTPEEIVGVIQQTPMPSLQQVHTGIQKAIKVDRETHVLMLLMKDALEKHIKGMHIQNRYGH